VSGGVWLHLRTHRRVAIGLALAVALVGIAVIGPLLTADPLARDIDRGLTELGAPLGPSGDALLGTDQLGRDVWARIVGGASTSLAVAAAATLIALALGLAVGLAAGYAGGRVDGALMRLVDLVLAFPVLLLAILLAALLRESSLAGSSVPLVATLAVVGWTTMARVLRDKARVLARGEMVMAARAAGAGAGRIVVRHLLPNVLGLVAVLTALGFAQNLLAESVLSYLGLGPPPPAPTWGRMLFEGRMYYRTAPHLVLAPGLAILIAVAAFHLLASGLRDLFDPKANANANANANAKVIR
jgi:peptide/nickel transport system permease protein